MDIWKIATVFFAILAGIGFYLFYNANNTADSATKRLKNERQKNGALQAASADASAFISWYRINSEESTLDDYKREVKTLHDKFINHFPNLAKEATPPAETNGKQ